MTHPPQPNPASARPTNTPMQSSDDTPQTNAINNVTIDAHSTENSAGAKYGTEAVLGF